VKFRLAFAGFCALLLSACVSMPRAQRLQAADHAADARSDVEQCLPENPCAPFSPLRELGETAYSESTPQAPRHRLVLLDRGQDALLARLHLIRSARRSIEVQTFIFERDDSGGLLLDALMDAARRGVKVRVMLDQLYGLSDPDLQARLASFHRNFELRLYNPTFEEARTQQLEFAAGIIFSFRRFNQRMHTKLFLVDDRVAVVGGRNLQDRYFDWSAEYNYRDRDLLVAGPVTAAMAENFEQFWRSPRAVPAELLVDVASRLLEQQPLSPIGQPLPVRERSARVLAMSVLASDGARTFARLQPYLLAVGRVEFFGDLPSKHDNEQASRSAASQAMRDLLVGSEREIVLQTPYLVMSRPARTTFRVLQRRPSPPKVLVSTNSLAATDAFPVYAMSHKYKRLYLRELGFQIHEFKPFPLTSPIDLAATGALAVEGRPPQALGAALGNLGSAGSGGRRRGPVPLKIAGVRVGLHAKSMVIDDRIGVVGSHNFDPRSDDYNTESLVVVHDAVFAVALNASIRADMRPENAWLVAPRAKLPILSGLNYSLGKLSEKLPIFDLWPFPYATSYQLQPECQPVPFKHPDFTRCYRDVGDFPEVDLGMKSVYTRILTAFGAGLVPIL